MDCRRVHQRIRRRLADVLPAAVLGAILLASGSQWSETQVPPHRAIDLTGNVLLTVIAAALLVRRRLPLAVLAAETLLVAAFLAAGYPHGPYLLALVLVGLVVGRTHPRRIALLAAAGSATTVTLSAVVSFVSGYLGTGWNLAVAVAVGIVVTAVPVLVGGLVRQAKASAARAEEEATRRRVESERLRMAREVHDVVGHSLSIISLQAGVALHVLDRRPEQAQISLEAIRRTSVEALDELRATLALTRAGQAVAVTPVTGGARQAGRDGTAGGAWDCTGTGRTGTVGISSTETSTHAISITGTGAAVRPADRMPLTGLARLPGLLAEIRLCGVPVEAVIAGPLDALPADVELAVYRIVQESLTNVLRHARDAQVTVGLRVEGRTVVVDVTDSPNSAVSPFGPPTGHGLAGLQERAMELGGQLTAGPHTDGGWRVRAVLPVRPEPAGPGRGRTPTDPARATPPGRTPGTAEVTLTTARDPAPAPAPTPTPTPTPTGNTGEGGWRR
jgi:signal transduction histidine kinase